MRIPKKITALPTVSTIKNADWFALVQDGVTSKVTFDDLNKAIGDERVTGGTYDPDTGCGTFSTNSGHTFVVCGFLTGYTDSYTTGATLNGGVIEFGNTLFGDNYYSVDIGDLSFSGGSGTCITDLYITNLHGCTPVTVHDNLQHISSSATGINSIAWGTGATASGNFSHAEGSSTAEGVGAHAEGYLTLASGNISHSEGDQTIASGGNSHAQNCGVIAAGLCSHAGGEVLDITNRIIASGQTSFVHYKQTISATTYIGAYGDYSAILGGSDHHILLDATSSGIFAGSGNTISTGVVKTVVLGGDNITASQSDTAYVPQLNIKTLGSSPSVTNLGIDSSGFVVTGSTSSGGVSIDPYNNVGNASTLTWDVSGVSTNYEITLTANTSLTMTNVRNGDYGTLIIHQDNSGNRELTFAAGTNYVVNGGGGAPTLTTDAFAIDILSFTYNGNSFFWTVGNDYTA